jgi:hypothetical protein
MSDPKDEGSEHEVLGTDNLDDNLAVGEEADEPSLDDALAEGFDKIEQQAEPEGEQSPKDSDRPTAEAEVPEEYALKPAA